MSLRIFLSYSGKDADLANVVKSKIEEILPGHRREDVRIEDSADLIPGEDIRKSLKAKIAGADTVVVISSKESDASPMVNYEVGLAHALGKDLVLVEKTGTQSADMHDRLLGTARIVRMQLG